MPAAFTVPPIPPAKRAANRAVVHLAKAFELQGLGPSLAVECAAEIIHRGFHATEAKIERLAKVDA